MEHYLLTAGGPDKPGIVAAVARILYGLGCNLEDSAMTRLQGEFAILLIFTAPDKAKPALLKSRLKALEKTFRLSVALKPMAPRERRSPASAKPLCLVSVYGADQPGIVFKVTDLLTRQKVNVIDLTTHRTARAGSGSGYILYLEGEMPGRLSPEALEGTLRDQTREMGITVSVKPIETSPL